MNNKITLVSLSFIIGFILMIINAKIKKDSTVNRFLNNLTFLPILFIGIGVFISLAIWEQSLEGYRKDSFLTIVDRIFIDMAKDFDTYYSKAPNLINSLFLPWQKKYLDFDKTKLETPDDWTVVNFISLRIFQAWEDFLVINKIDETGSEAWINIFIPYACSHYLKSIWDTTKNNYTEPTRLLGNLLFEKCVNNPPNNTEEIYELSEKIMNSDEYKYLIQL